MTSAARNEDLSVWFVQWVQGRIIVCVRTTVYVYRVSAIRQWDLDLECCWELVEGKINQQDAATRELADERVAELAAGTRLQAFGREGGAELTNYRSVVLWYNPTWAREFWSGNPVTLRDQLTSHFSSAA